MSIYLFDSSTYVYNPKRPILTNITMTLEHYNRLSEEKRAFILDKAGIFVAAIYNKHYEFNLFMLNSFYVEVIYKIDGTLCGSRAFINTSQLDRYLHSIDISPLMV